MVSAPNTFPGIPSGEHVPTADGRVVMHGVPWAQFELFLVMRGDQPAPRIAYLDGALELMSPSRDHERIKSVIGRLVEVYAIDRDVEIGAYGSWTLKHAPKEAGAEPDECYIIGDQSKERPDLAIEVIWTSGGIDKLEIYRRLSVGEVWMWRDGSIEVYVLRNDAYERVDRSLVLPGVDLDLLASFVDRPSLTHAVRDYRAALKKS
jgi:Uma2 family endonuclease